MFQYHLPFIHLAYLPNHQLQFPMLLVSAQDQMFSKLNPLNYYRKGKKTSSPSPKDQALHQALNPWFLKMWKRTPSESSMGEHRRNTVVSRSQLKKSRIAASQAMAVPSVAVSQVPRREQIASHNDDIQPYAAGNGELLSPEYFVDVNLRYTNTNTTSMYSSRESILDESVRS